MFPLIKGIEVLAGVLLLSNRLVPLALLLLAPIIVNIAAIHLVLAPSLGMVVALVGLELFLAWSYRDVFRHVLRVRNEASAVAQVGRTDRSPVPA